MSDLIFTDEDVDNLGYHEDDSDELRVVFESARDNFIKFSIVSGDSDFKPSDDEEDIW